MPKLGEIVGGIFLLILVYLVLTNWTGTVAIIGTIGSNAVQGIKTLQGR